MTSDKVTARRERRIEDRKAQILDGAARVFAEKGFHAATTKEIADAADVSEGTIYNYFASKDDLLIGMMARLAALESLSGELAEALRSDARQFFITIFRYRLVRLTDFQQVFHALLPEILVNSSLREEFRQHFLQRIATMLEGYVQARIDMGHIRPVNTALATRAVQAMLLGLLVLSIIGDEVVDTQWDQFPETLATLIFDGLRPREGE